MRRDGIEIRLMWIRPDEDLDLSAPAYQSELAAGMDVQAAITESVTMEPGSIHMIPSGFAVALCDGYELQVRPRSGLAIKHGITIVNAPGTIDADYRGEVKVGLVNLSAKPFIIHRGDRIAQMVLAPVCRAIINEVKELPETLRQEGGFGHTGI